MRKTFTLLLCLCFISFLTSCSIAKKIEIFDLNTPIYNNNKVLSVVELNEIYQIFEFGFGGSELFNYLKSNDICGYRMISNEKNFYYTCLQVKDTGLLYIFLEKNESEYMVSHLLFKDNNSIYTKEDFEKLKMQESTINDVIKIDKNTKYNTLYTSSVGTITTHFLSDGTILRLYYSTDSLSQIMHISYENKENTIGYIQSINDIDWV